MIIKELIVEVKEGLLTIKDLSSYLKLWELMIGVGLFAFLLGWSIYTIPTLDDDGVYAADDVIVSWYCSGGGRRNFRT